MAGRYLTDLADVLRSAGLTVIEVPGWQNRARGSGGYAAGRPSCLMVHHTASKPASDGQGDVNYIIAGSPVAPIANLYTARKGVVWVCAAGATNTNGAGGPLDGVPKDQMNLYAIGNEIANDGVGEPYPILQQESVLTSSRAITKHYGIQSVRAHFEWAPSRKIDPSGPSKWAPYGGKWNMDAFRADVFADTGPIPPPVPPTEGAPEMILLKYTKPGDTSGAWTGMVTTGTQLAHIVNSHAWAIPAGAGAPVVEVTDVELDGYIQGSQTTMPPPPEFSAARQAAWNARRG